MAETCFECARGAMTVTPDERACSICSQELDAQGRCGNTRLCRSPSRHIHRIHALGVLTGPIEDNIKRLKYQGKTGWARIFGRLLYGFMEENYDPWEVGLIVANPVWLGEGSHSTVDHTGLVVRSAAKSDVLGTWPFDTSTPGVLSLAGPPPQSARTASAKERRENAILLRDLLRVEPGHVEGKSIVVYDDVCTTGSQLEACAQVLIEHGAQHVEAVVLARTPWGSS